MIRLISSALAFILSVLLAVAAGATTLYKHVDKDGRVTYTDRPQAEPSGKVITVPIEQNKLAPPPPKSLATPPREESEYEKIIRRKPAANDDSEIVTAKRRLDEAKRALEQARESASPDDWIYTGNRPGFGLRRHARPEYLERLERLEADVRAAEEKLAEAERRR
jgi:hypothetical protein